jgi:hypothetical protein
MSPWVEGIALVCGTLTMIVVSSLSFVNKCLNWEEPQPQIKRVKK